MPISRAKKEELVEQYKELLAESIGFAVLQADKMPVKKVEGLRRKIREAGGLVIVTKNTLIGKALEQSGWAIPSSILSGKTAIVFGMDNFPGVAKALLEYLKTENPEPNILSLKGGVMSGTQILTADGIKTVSELPTLPELQAQIIGLIIAPSQNLVNVLYAAEASVVNVLQAWLDKDKQPEAAS